MPDRTLSISIVTKNTAFVLSLNYFSASITLIERLTFANRNLNRLLMLTLWTGNVANHFSLSG